MSGVDGGRTLLSGLVVWVQIRLCSVEGRCVRAFRVTIEDDYGLCIVVGAQHVGLWLHCVSASQERSPETCIVAAFAAHQWTSAVIDGRCI